MLSSQKDNFFFANYYSSSQHFIFFQLSILLIYICHCFCCRKLHHKSCAFQENKNSMSHTTRAAYRSIHVNFIGFSNCRRTMWYVDPLSGLFYYIWLLLFPTTCVRKYKGRSTARMLRQQRVHIRLGYHDWMTVRIIEIKYAQVPRYSTLNLAMFHGKYFHIPIRDCFTKCF